MTSARTDTRRAASSYQAGKAKIRASRSTEKKSIESFQETGPQDFLRAECPAGGNLCWVLAAGIVKW